MRLREKERWETTRISWEIREEDIDRTEAERESRESKETEEVGIEAID